MAKKKRTEAHKAGAGAVPTKNASEPFYETPAFLTPLSTQGGIFMVRTRRDQAPFVEASEDGGKNLVAPVPATLILTAENTFASPTETRP